MMRWMVLVTMLLVSCACGKGGGAASQQDFTEISYTLSNEVFSNPERGFMHLYTVESEGASLDAGRLQALAAENVTLVHRVYYFEKFKQSPLSDAELALIKGDMQLLRNAGVKCVLGFAYTGIDYVENTEKGEDAPLASIELHLDQLKPVLEENKDIIAFVQAGFIGPWGEWHSSTNGLETPENMTKVLNKMLSVIPKEIMVQVRTPRYKQTIFGTNAPVDQSTGFSGVGRARVGHYNDCLMASADDYGTYTNVQADKQYISSEGLYVPTGGETCPPIPAGNTPGCPEATATLRQLRWTYLNLDWYGPTINAWKAGGCFEELQRNLGYRLALVRARLPDKVTAGQALDVHIKIANKGYAPVYNYKAMHLVLKDKASGTFRELPVAVDIRECKPLAELEVQASVSTAGIPAGSYAMYLKIADQAEGLRQKAAFSIRLANENTWMKDDGGINDLQHSLTIGN